MMEKPELPRTEAWLRIYDMVTEVAQKEGLDHREAFRGVVACLELLARKTQLETEIASLEKREAELRQQTRGELVVLAALLQDRTGKG